MDARRPGEKGSVSWCLAVISNSIIASLWGEREKERERERKREGEREEGGRKGEMGRENI